MRRNISISNIHQEMDNLSVDMLLMCNMTVSKLKN